MSKMNKFDKFISPLKRNIITLEEQIDALEDEKTELLATIPQINKDLWNNGWVNNPEDHIHGLNMVPRFPIGYTLDDMDNEIYMMDMVQYKSDVLSRIEEIDHEDDELNDELNKIEKKLAKHLINHRLKSLL